MKKYTPCLFHIFFMVLIYSCSHNDNTITPIEAPIVSPDEIIEVAKHLSIGIEFWSIQEEEVFVSHRQITIVCKLLGNK